MKALTIGGLVALIAATVALAGGSAVRQQVKTTSSKTTTKLCVYVDHRAGQTYGDLSTVAKFPSKTCIVGKRGLRGLRGPAGPQGTTTTEVIQGIQGPAGPQGPAGTDGRDGADGQIGARGPAGPSLPGDFATAYAQQEDHGCDSGNEVWALDQADRTYRVTPDGAGSWLVTRYDVGSYVTIPGAHLATNGPCGEETYSSAQDGTFNGVWTQKVSGDYDYNPAAGIPDGATWDQFVDAVFNGGTLTHVGYEYDYYNACGDHWRDADEGAAPSGQIGNC